MLGNEAAFAQGGATVCVLASGGAADCVIIAAYTESIRRAFLVHATRSTDLGQVKALIEKFCTDRTGRTEVYTSSRALRDQPESDLLRDVRALFPRTGVVRLATEYVSGQLVIDPTTGEVLSALGNVNQYGMEGRDLPILGMVESVGASSIGQGVLRVTSYIPSIETKIEQFLARRRMVSDLGVTPNVGRRRAGSSGSAAKPKPEWQ